MKTLKISASLFLGVLVTHASRADIMARGWKAGSVTRVARLVIGPDTAKTEEQALTLCDAATGNICDVENMGDSGLTRASPVSCISFAFGNADNLTYSYLGTGSTPEISNSLATINCSGDTSISAGNGCYYPLQNCHAVMTFCSDGFKQGAADLTNLSLPQVDFAIAQAAP